MEEEAVGGLPRAAFRVPRGVEVGFMLAMVLAEDMEPIRGGGDIGGDDCVCMSGGGEIGGGEDGVSESGVETCDREVGYSLGDSRGDSRGDSSSDSGEVGSDMVVV